MYIPEHSGTCWFVEYRNLPGISFILFISYIFRRCAFNKFQWFSSVTPVSSVWGAANLLKLLLSLVITSSLVYLCSFRFYHSRNYSHHYIMEASLEHHWHLCLEYPHTIKVHHDNLAPNVGGHSEEKSVVLFRFTTTSSHNNGQGSP